MLIDNVAMSRKRGASRKAQEGKVHGLMEAKD